MTMQNTRYEKFRVYMIANDYRWSHIGKLLGVTQYGAMNAIKRDTISKVYHDKLIAFGAPAECLPQIKKADETTILQRIEAINKSFEEVAVNAE